MGSSFSRKLCTSAHIGGQVLTLKGQTCSLGRAFTTSFLVNGVKCRSYTLLVKDELTDIPMKASTQIAKTIRRGGIEQLKRVF